MKFFTIILMIAMPSCMTTAGKREKPQALKQTESAPLWFTGEVKDAFERAQANDKDLLLYWGAAWCPPCNELKSQVFHHSDFKKLTSDVIRVYLDGDSESAQIWGEELQASGYPTLMLLSKDRKELLRLSASMTFKEFQNSFLAARAAGSLDKALTAIDNNRATDADWLLISGTSWGQTPDSVVPDTPKKRLALFEKLFTRAPKSKMKVRAILASNILTTAEGLNEKEKDEKTEKTRIAKMSGSLLDVVFNNAITIRAARSFILYSSKDIVNWLHPKENTQKKSLITRWLGAADLIAQDTSLSVDTRLWAHFPTLQLTSTKDDIPDATKVIIRNAVETANMAAKSKYERHAVVSGAAYLLRKIGDFAKAREILTQEAKTTDTPWYYQSSLARLEETAGNKEKALYWSAMARKSASGRATKLQWLVGDLLFQLKHDADSKVITALVQEYYEFAFSLKDGFSGRNLSRAKRLAKAFNKKPVSEPVKALILANKSRCDKIAEHPCHKHFEKLSL